MNEIERAIERLEHQQNLYPKNYRILDGAIDLAIFALREKAERENPKPLTLKELLDMNGKPLWIAIKDSKVHVCEIRCVILSNIYSEIGFGYTIVKFTDGSLCYLEDYMEKWLAYRYKPKEVRE